MSSVLSDVHVVVDVFGVDPQQPRVLVQLDQAVAVRRIALGVIDGQQVPVGIEVAPEPVNLVRPERLQTGSPSPAAFP